MVDTSGSTPEQEFLKLINKSKAKTESQDVLAELKISKRIVGEACEYWMKT